MSRSMPEICTKTACRGKKHGCLTQAVLDLAKVLGWRTAHFRPARVMRNGKAEWRTPVAGDGAGFPDVVLARPGYTYTLKVRELKVAGKKLSPEQRQWLKVFAACGVDAGYWTTEDWFDGTIERELR